MSTILCFRSLSEKASKGSTLEKFPHLIKTRSLTISPQSENSFTKMLDKTYKTFSLTPYYDLRRSKTDIPIQQHSDMPGETAEDAESGRIHSIYYVCYVVMMSELLCNLL